MRNHATLIFPPLADSIDTIQAIGSYNNRVLLLVNSDLVCTVTFDPEFSRMIVLRCLSIELSTDAYADSSLPQWVGPIVNVTFVRPLMFALTQDGLVCILTFTMILILIFI